MNWQDKLKQLYATAPFPKLLGISLSFDHEKHSHLHLPFKKDLTHENGGVHGGVFATLLDDAGWFASAIWHEGVWVTTSEFKVHLLRPVESDDLHAEGKLIKRGRRMDIAEMSIYSGGKLVAAGMGTYVVLENVAFGKDKV